MDRVDRMPSKPRRKGAPTPLQLAREQRIFATCRRLLGELGDEAMTIRDLAAASDVAVGTLYNRYGTKDALLTRVVLDLFRTSVLARIDLDDTQSRPLQQLVRNIRIMARETRRNRAFSRVLLGAYFRVGGRREMTTQLHQAVLHTIGVPIRRMAQDRLLQDWIPTKDLAEELTQRFFAVSMGWAQGRVPAASYEDRTVSSTLMSLVSVSTPTQAAEAANLLEDLHAR